MSELTELTALSAVRLVEGYRKGEFSPVEVARAAQAVRPGCRTILVSGYATAQLPPLPESVVYLGKPFRVQQLIDTLAGATGSPA